MFGWSLGCSRTKPSAAPPYHMHHARMHHLTLITCLTHAPCRSRQGDPAVWAHPPRQPDARPAVPPAVHPAGWRAPLCGGGGAPPREPGRADSGATGFCWHLGGRLWSHRATAGTLLPAPPLLALLARGGLHAARSTCKSASNLTTLSMPGLQGDRRAGPSLSAYNYESVWGQRALREMYLAIIGERRAPLALPPACRPGAAALPLLARKAAEMCCPAAGVCQQPCANSCMPAQGVTCSAYVPACVCHRGCGLLPLPSPTPPPHPSIPAGPQGEPPAVALPTFLGRARALLLNAGVIRHNKSVVSGGLGRWRQPGLFASAAGWLH